MQYGMRVVKRTYMVRPAAGLLVMGGMDSIAHNFLLTESMMLYSLEANLSLFSLRFFLFYDGLFFYRGEKCIVDVVVVVCGRLVLILGGLE